MELRQRLQLTLTAVAEQAEDALGRLELLLDIIEPTPVGSLPRTTISSW